MARVVVVVPQPQKRKAKERDDSGKAALAPRRKRSPAAFPNAAKATAIPVSVQRLIRFFTPANHGTEAMHTDARFRDTLATAASAVAAIAPEISAPSLDL